MHPIEACLDHGEPQPFCGWRLQRREVVLRSAAQERRARLFFAKGIHIKHEDAGQDDDEGRMVKAERKGLAAWQIGGEVPCFADEGWSCDRAEW